MPTKPMDKSAEAQLLGTVRDVSSQVESGASPTEAIVKAARDGGIGHNMIPLVVHAYNVGRTTWQQNTGEGLLGKQANFPIARLEDVMGAIYPETPSSPGQRKSASAVSNEYSFAPSMPRPDDVQEMEKVAHYTLPVSKPVDRGPGDPMIKMSKAYGQAMREKRSVEEAQYQQNVARDLYLGSLGAICEYFKQAAYWRKPFADVEYNAQLLWGEPAKHAMEYAYVQNGMSEKRATGPPSHLAPADPNIAPYQLIKGAIDMGASVIKASQHHQQLRKAADVRIDELVAPFVFAPNAETTPFSVLGASQVPSSHHGAKEAGLFGNLVSMGVGASARGATIGDKPKEQMVGKAQLELSDPDHMQELQEIETRAMLSDLMNNDEVISGFDPEEVTNAYNEIAQLSPRGASQPAVIRPLLRKQLTQGAVEPFEAQQMADIEKTLTQTSPPPQLGGLGEGGGAKNEVLSGSSILQ